MRTALALAVLLLVAAATSAHGPPAKRDQDFRLLADHNDDCGDDADVSGCHGTHDLVGLDVLERHDGGLGDVVAFRLILNGGSGSLRDVLTFKADGAAKSFELRTSDNQAFQGDKGTDRFDSVARFPATNPDGSTDGSRFVVEATVRLATLGGAGAKLTDYKVEAYAGTAKGDYMPGGYVNGLGIDTANPPQGEGVTNFNRVNGYVLTGPTYYTTVDVPASATLAADGQTVVPIRLTNPFRSTAQTATVTVAGADGFTATWVGANGADPAVEDLAKGGSGTAELRLRGDGHAPTAGTLTITVTTNLGGRSVHTLPYEITAAQGSTGDGTGSGAPPAAKDKDSPAPAAVLVGLALLVLAALRRTA